MACLAIRPSRITGTVLLELQSENFHIVLSKPISGPGIGSVEAVSKP